jgi:hypothetical protein
LVGVSDEPVDGVVDVVVGVVVDGVGLYVEVPLPNVVELPLL